MVSRKHRIAMRVGLFLLVIMLFFTFFSSTINSFLTPRVTITVARQGMIMHEVEGEMEALTGIVIPLASIIGDQGVYVVKQVDTFLGDQLYIEYREVEIIGRNYQQAVIIAGLSDAEYIITSWDRPLKDGQRVMLPFE